MTKEVSCLKIKFGKLAAVVISLSVISGNFASVSAAEVLENTNDITNRKDQNNKKQILTLEEAINSAINISDILELDEKKINYKENINDINEKIDDSPQLVGKAEIDIPEEKKELNEDVREIQLKQAKQQRDFDEDKLIQKVINNYNNIVTSQMKIDKAKRELELKNKELSYAKLKNEIGAIALIDLEANELKIQDLKDKEKASENVLKDAKENFKVLTGKDVNQYTLEQDINYEVFKIDGSVDEYLEDVIENYLKYSTKIIKLNKDYLKDNKVEDIKEEDKPSKEKPTFNSSFDIQGYGDYENKLEGYYQEREMYAFKLSMRLSYLNAKIGNYESETNLNETKKQFKEQLRNFYTSLITAEDSINLLKKNIIFSNKQLRISKLKYEDELITKIDYENEILKSDELELQLRNAIDRYNTLKEQIQKPWIAFSK